MNTVTSAHVLAFTLHYAEPPSFSTAEIVLLAILIVLSVAGFFWRFDRVLRNIFTARKDPDFHIAPIGKRIWDFFWEVLCQAKVIRERPLPGLAHAFVFWGFLAFALVSLNHFASGFRLGFLDASGWVGGFYFWFAAVFALLVAVSIAGLFVRRFFVRPIWLGRKVSYESGVIAFLIFALMVTYLAGFVVSPASAPARGLWWAHALCILAFLPLIPHTKHLHLVLSPITIFLSRGEFSHIPPLAGDEDFGLVTGKDVTQLVALQAYSCVECGRCTEHCPAANTGKVLNPKEIILGVRNYLNDLGPHSEELLLGKYNSQEAAFQCTTCGACEFQCPVGIEHLPVIIGLRRGAVNTGAYEDDHGTKLFLALERSGNALGMSAAERDKFIKKQELPIFDGSQEYCLWLGCMGAYDPQGREIIASFAKVMDYLGTSYGVLKKEKCTGDPVRRLGNDLVFQQLAEQNLEIMKQQKVTKIVTICPHCVRTIAKDWKDFGASPEIEHHSEFMARYQDKLPKTNGPEIVYHDPCYLGRYRGSYDQPREVLARSGKVIDPPRARERSFCCGAGGGLAFLGEESGERVSHVRAKELVATGAGIVGAACPFCNTMFRDALAAVSDAPPQLLDIAQITAQTIAAPVHRQRNRYTEWSTERMKIIVAIKQVPVRDSSLHIDASGHWIDEDDLSYEINEPDAYALEEALQLKEKHGGEVVALLAGPERGSQTIREALAKGADRAIHIECDDLASLDTLGIASRLAAAIKDEKADLILTGLQSDDLGLGQTGVVLAELLGIPHATIIMQVEAGEGSIKVKRELEDGWFQHVQMPLPALLTIQSGISKLRYATLMGIKKAKTKEVRRVSAGELPQAGAPTVTLERVYLPEKKKETQLIEGSPKEAAAKLVEKLKFEVRVI